MKKIGIVLAALMTTAIFLGCSNSNGGSEPQKLGDGTLNDEFILDDWTDFKDRSVCQEQPRPLCKGFGDAIYYYEHDFELDYNDEYFYGKNNNLRIVHHHAGHEQTTTKSETNGSYYDKKVDGGINIKADSISIETSDGKPLVGHYIAFVYYTSTVNGKLEAKEGNEDPILSDTNDKAWVECQLSAEEATPLYLGASDTITITKIEVTEQPY